MFQRANNHLKENTPLTYSQAMDYLNRGKLLNADRNFDAALKCLQQAYSYFVYHKHNLMEDYASTVYFMGCCYKEKGLNEKAKEYLDDAYSKYFLLTGERDTNYRISLLLNVSIDLAQIYISEGRHKEARHILINTKKISANFFLKNQDIDINLMGWMSDICTLLGECTHSLEESLSYFVEANQLRPTAALGIRICILLIDSNKIHLAHQYLSGFLIHELDDQLKADVRYHLARCCLKLNKNVEAYCYLEQAREFYASQPLNYVLVALGLALTAYGMGNDKEGNEQLHQFLLAFHALISASDIEIANRGILDWCEKARFPDHFNFYKNPNLVTLSKLLAVIKNDADNQKVTSDQMELSYVSQFKPS